MENFEKRPERPIPKPNPFIIPSIIQNLGTFSLTKRQLRNLSQLSTNYHETFRPKYFKLLENNIQIHNYPIISYYYYTNTNFIGKVLSFNAKFQDWDPERAYLFPTLRLSLIQDKGLDDMERYKAWHPPPKEDPWPQIIPQIIPFLTTLDLSGTQNRAINPHLQSITLDLVKRFENLKNLIVETGDDWDKSDLIKFGQILKRIEQRNLIIELRFNKHLKLAELFFLEQEFSEEILQLRSQIHQVSFHTSIDDPETLSTLATITSTIQIPITHMRIILSFTQWVKIRNPPALLRDLQIISPYVKYLYTYKWDALNLFDSTVLQWPNVLDLNISDYKLPLASSGIKNCPILEQIYINSNQELCLFPNQDEQKDQEDSLLNIFGDLVETLRELRFFSRAYLGERVILVKDGALHKYLCELLPKVKIEIS